MIAPPLSALYDACVAAPAADAPRIAFAAALDASGDSWGAFIRAQLAQTQALRRGDQRAGAQHGREADALLRGHSAQWDGGVGKLVRVAAFSRGLVEKIAIDTRTYLARAAELYKQAPIRMLVLSDLEQVDAVLADPHLDQLVSLAIGRGGSPLGDAGLAKLAACPRLARLRELDISFQDIGMSGLEALCASKQLRALAYVGFAGNNVALPAESAGTDWATGDYDLNGLTFPQLGRELEAKYGELAWLHPLTKLQHCPPSYLEL